MKQLTDRYHEKHGLSPEIFRAHVLPYLSDVPHLTSNQRLISFENYDRWRVFNAIRNISEDEASYDSDSSSEIDMTEMEIDFIRFLHDFIDRHEKSQFSMNLILKKSNFSEMCEKIENDSDFEFEI